MREIDRMRQLFSPDRSRDPMQYAPLVLAYVGDTVYDLYVRTRLVLQTDATNHDLHKKATSLVCAAAQARAAHRIADQLTEREQAVFRRGRNSHLGNVPKNAQLTDYRAATGLEALVGYLYLCGEDQRLDELMQQILCEDEKGNEHGI